MIPCSRTARLATRSEFRKPFFINLGLARQNRSEEIRRFNAIWRGGVALVEGVIASNQRPALDSSRQERLPRIHATPTASPTSWLSE